MGRHRSSLFALPLATWERDGLKAALARAGLPAADLETEGPLFWRFERDDMPVGFAGIEVHGAADPLLARDFVRFFAKLGYAPCGRERLPPAIAAAGPFAQARFADATAMVKQV